MSHGATNWPFFTLMARPVLAAAISRSVWRQRNAGICSIASTGPSASLTCLALLRGVDVGQHGQLVGLAHGAQDAATFLQARAAKAADRRAIGLVVAGLEDVRDAQVGGDALDGVGEFAGVRLGLDHAGAGDQKQLATAHRDVAKSEAGRRRHASRIADG
jgi:hypothetical protein